MTQYQSELVDSTVITKKGVDVFVDVFVYHFTIIVDSNIYRAVVLPQQIDDGVPATRYLIRKSDLLVSETTILNGQKTKLSHNA